jgi:hypothetical protein
MVKILVAGLKKNQKMILFLRVMYYSAFLPINWTITDENETIIKISTLKSILLVLFDILLVFMIPAYVYFWHWLNIEEFNLGQLVQLSYYLELNEGVMTTTLCQLLYITFPMLMFWIYCWIGNYD